MAVQRQRDAFISFSNSDAFSAFFCDIVAQVLDELGFTVDRYANEQREVEWSNFDVTAVEGSLAAAEWADVAACIIVPTYCGWILEQDTTSGAAWEKSICRMEFEAAQAAGRHVISIIPDPTLIDELDGKKNPSTVQPFDNEFRDLHYAYMKSLLVSKEKELQHPDRFEREQRVLTEFLGVAKNSRSNITFQSLKTLRNRLKRQLQDWLRSRDQLAAFPQGNDPFPSRRGIVEVLAERMQQSGRIAITGSWGWGGSTVAIQAARRSAEKRRYSRMVYVDCRGKTESQIFAELSRQVDESDAGLHKLELQRNLILLDSPPAGMDIPFGNHKATCVVVTSNRGLIRQLGIRANDEFSVPAPSLGEGRELYADRLTVQRDREPQAFEQLVELLQGSPLMLGPARAAILSDPTDTPLANFVDELQAGDFSSILQILLARIDRSDLEVLAKLSVLPHSGFGIECACGALSTADQKTTQKLLYRLTDMSPLVMLGDQQWRVTPELRNLLKSDARWEKTREEVLDRIGDALIEQLSSPSPANPTTEPLVGDFDFLLQAVLPKLTADRQNSKAVISALLKRAKAQWDWAGVQRVCCHAIDMFSASHSPKDHVFYQWEAGKAASRRQDYPAALLHLNAALEQTQSTDFDHRPKILTSLASVLSAQGQHAEASVWLRQAIALEGNRRSGVRGLYIAQHTLAKSLWFLKQSDEATALLQASLISAESKGDRKHLAQAYLTQAKFFRESGAERSAADAFQRALDMTPNTPCMQRCLVLERHADFLIQQKKWQAAKQLLESAAKIANHLSESDLQANIYSNFLVVINELGDEEVDEDQFKEYEKLEKSLERRLQTTLRFCVLRQSRNRLSPDDNLLARLRSFNLSDLPLKQAAVLLNQLGEVYRRAGATAEAIESHQKAIEHSRRDGNQKGTTIGTLQLAKSLKQAKRYDEAIELLQTRIDEQACSDFSKSRMLTMIGQLRIKIKDFDGAEKTLLRSQELEKKLDGAGTRSLAYPLHSLGNVCIKRRRFQKAVTHLEGALAIERQHHNTRGQMIVHHSLAQAELGRRRFRDAEDHIDESLKLQQSLHDDFHRCQLLHTHARIKQATGNTEQAVAKLEESLQLADTHASQPRFWDHQILVRAHIASLRLQADRGEEAEKLLKAALRIAREHSEISLQIFLLRRLAHLRQGNAAIETLTEALNLGLDNFLRLSSDRELRPVVGQLIAALRRTGREAELNELLERLIAAIRSHTNAQPLRPQMSRLRIRAVCELGHLLLRRPPSSGAAAVWMRYRKECDASIFDRDFRALRGILLDWCSCLKNRGDVDQAVMILDEYVQRLTMHAPCRVVYSLLFRKAEWLANRARRRRVDDRSDLWRQALRACLQAERFARRASSPIGTHRVRLIRAAMHLDSGRKLFARRLLHRWFQEVSREDYAQDLIISDERRFDSQCVASLDAIQLWARIDLIEAIDLLDRFSVLSNSLNVKLDQIDIVCLKARMLRQTRPYSAEKTLAEAYDAAGQEQDVTAQGRLAIAMGRLFQQTQQHSRAKTEFERAVQHYVPLNDPIGTCDALRTLSIHLRHQLDEKQEALIYAELALQQLLDIHDRRRVPARNSVVKLLRELGHLEKAHAEARDAIEDAQRWGEPRLEGAARLTYAAVLDASDDSAASLRELTEVLARLDQDPVCNAYRFALKTRGQAHYRLRLIPEAVKDFTHFLDLSESIGYPDEEVLDVRCRLAKAFRLLGLLPSALQLVDQALAEIDEQKWLHGRVRTIPPLLLPIRDSLRIERGMIHIEMNQFQEACEGLDALVQERQQAKSDLQENVFSSEMDALHRTLARAYSCLGIRDEALENLERSVIEDDADQRNHVIWHLDCAFVHQRLGSDSEAIEHISNAWQKAQDIPDQQIKLTLQASVLAREASLHTRQGQHIKAIDAASRSSEIASMLLNSEYLLLHANEQLARAQIAADEATKAIQTIAQAEELQKAILRAIGREHDVSQKDAIWTGLALQTQRQIDPHGCEVARLSDKLKSQCLRLAEQNVHMGTDDVVVSPSTHSAATFENQDTANSNALLTGTVTFIRETGSPLGLEVMLKDGRRGRCHLESAFGGMTGNLKKGYAAYQDCQFHVLKDAQPQAAEGEVVMLSAHRDWSPIIGKNVRGRLLDESKAEDPDRPFLMVEIDSGEHVPIAFPDDVGWFAVDGYLLRYVKKIRGCWDERSDIVVRIGTTDEQPPQLTASLRQVYQQILEFLKDTQSPIIGRVLDEDEEYFDIELALGVVAICHRDDITADPKRAGHVKPGHRIAVVIQEIHPDYIVVNRARALRLLVADSGDRFLLGKFIKNYPFGNRGVQSMLEFAPGFVGMGNRLPDRFQPGDEVSVQIQPQLSEKHSIDWKHDASMDNQHRVRLEDVEDIEDLESFLWEAEDVIEEPHDALPLEPNLYLPGKIPHRFRNHNLQPFQRTAMRAISHGDNTLVCAPTGAGKTLIADWAIEEVLNQRRRAIFASPVKALSNQKFRDFQKAQRFPGQIGLITGDIKINPFAPVLVVTTETFRNWVIERPDSLRYFHLVIFDEVHYLDDENRGSAWEESIIYAPERMQMIALSATIPNVDELSRWMHAARDRPATVIPARPIKRPVPLEHQFCGITEFFRVFGTASQIPPDYLSNSDSGRPFAYKDEIEKGHAVVDHLKKHDHFPAIFFCSQRTMCKQYAEYQAQRLTLHTPESQVLAAAAFDTAVIRNHAQSATETETLRRLVTRGLGFHHSGLLPALKATVEELFEAGHIRLLYATDTFAIGVNMAARSVVFNSLFRGEYKAEKLMSGRQYAQMAGRSGRLQDKSRDCTDPTGTVYSLIAKRQVSEEQLLQFESGKVETISSRLDPSYRTMLTLFGDPRRGADPKYTIEGFWKRSFAFAQRNGTADATLSLMNSRWEFLQQENFCTDLGLTIMGQVCAGVSSNEVAITDAWSRGLLDELDPRQLAAVFGCFSCHKNIAGALQDAPRVASMDWWENLQKQIVHFQQQELKFGIPMAKIMKSPVQPAESLFAAWADGLDLESVGSRMPENATTGDFVNWTRMAIQALTSLAAALPTEDPCIPKLIEAHTLLDRDEVSWTV